MSELRVVPDCPDNTDSMMIGCMGCSADLGRAYDSVVGRCVGPRQMGAAMMGEENAWVCACGETDITKHDIGMVIAHEFDLSEQHGRDILVRIRDSAGLDTVDADRTVSDG